MPVTVYPGRGGGMQRGLTWGIWLSRLRETAPDPQPTSKMRGPPRAPTTWDLWVTSSSTHSTSSWEVEGSGSELVSTRPLEVLAQRPKHR